MQDLPLSSSSETSRAFWLRLTRALALVIAASAAHVWVDRAVRIPSSPAGPPAVPSGAPPTLVPASELRGRASRPAPHRVSVVTERIVVASPAAGVERPPQRRAGEPGAVATTGLVAAALAAEPDGAEVIADKPRAPSSDEAAQPIRQAVSAAPPPAAAPAEAPARDGEGDSAGAPLLEVSRLALLPPERSRVTAPVEADQRQLVRDLLQRYVTAFERLDVDAAKAVWPTVDGKALRRAFNQLQAQRVTFESCGITIAGAGANARCLGEATYHPRVGSRALHMTAREWTFQLARAEDGWQIVDAKVR